MTQPEYPDCAKRRVATCDVRFENIDQQAACLSGYDQKYQQVSCGKYHGWFRTVLLDDDVGLYFESFNQALDQWGASPLDRYGFIFFMDAGNCAHLGMRVFRGDDILFLPPGNAFDFRSPPRTSFCVVSIDRLVFETILRGSLGPDEASALSRNDTRVIRDEDCAGLLRQLVTFLVRRTGQQDAEGIAAGTLNGAKRSLLELTGGIVSSSFNADSGHPAEDSHSSEDLARRMRDFIRDRRGIGFGPAQLAEEFAISRRRLEQLFQTCFGKSPGEYIQTVKLNEFRSALLSQQNQSRSIGDVAASFEIWHLSRLAQTYRRHFGELPSEARKAMDGSVCIP